MSGASKKALGKPCKSESIVHKVDESLFLKRVLSVETITLLGKPPVRVAKEVKSRVGVVGPPAGD